MIDTGFGVSNGNEADDPGKIAHLHPDTEPMPQRRLDFETGEAQRVDIDHEFSEVVGVDAEPIGAKDIDTGQRPETAAGIRA